MVKQEELWFKLGYFCVEFSSSPQACVFFGFFSFPHQKYAQLIILNILIWAAEPHVSCPLPDTVVNGPVYGHGQ